MAILGWTMLMPAAQAAVVLSSLEIDLWPEYDRPGVLVIYRASIAPGAPLPTTLTFRLPAAVGEPSAVAELRSNGELVTVPFERRVDGDFATIEFTATRPRIQVEYYQPRISRDDATRSFSFRWPGDYEVGAFSVSAQLPDLARNLTLDPPATREERGADGLLYRTVARAGVERGEIVTVDVSYEKAVDQLSVDTLAPVQRPVAPAATGEGEPGAGRLAVGVGGALAVATVLAVLFAFRSRRTTVDSAPKRAAASFCTQCGGAAGSGDLFCHRCGTPIT